MEIRAEESRDTACVKIVAEEAGVRVARAFVYILHNELHPEPFAFMEDLYVEEAYRGKGVGSQMMQAVIAESKARGCYKLIFTSRHLKPEVQKWYQYLGFSDWGTEFRINL